MNTPIDINNFGNHKNDYQVTLDLVSLVGYLIGVPERIFESDAEPLQLSIYKQLDTNKNARIIRHLCIIRTAIERNYRHINLKMKTEFKTILSVPEYIPNESIQTLSNDGINFVKKSSTKISHHIIEINRLISDRINNCKPLFPLWLNWQYIRELFVMPNGLTEQGTKDAADLYYSNISSFPYQMYINWNPQDDGNILFNDKKFIRLLYEQHNDFFTEFSKVSDADNYIKYNIYDFLNESKKIVVVVDCENSDPYKLCGAFRNLSYEHTSKISKILLFDDIHTATTWGILEQFTQIPVEHILIERVKENKSLVDITLTARACQEHYKNNVDAFIIVSSDSDYWGLISSLPEARFLVMIEHEKCGPDMKDAMENAGIFYCYLDDFFTGNTEDLKHAALIREMVKYIHENLYFNVNSMFEEALINTRIPMQEAEKKQFYDRYIKTIKLGVNDNGNITIAFKN